MFKADEAASWRTTAALLSCIAIVIFCIQRTSWAFITNTLFEVCIFYLPAVLAVVVYLFMRSKNMKAAIERAAAGTS